MILWLSEVIPMVDGRSGIRSWVLGLNSRSRCSLGEFPGGPVVM